MDKIQLAQNLINSLLNETRKSAIAPRQLASIYQHILDIVAVDDEARDQAVKDAQTAASGAQQTLEQMQTITLQAAEDIGTVEILPTQSGAKTSNPAFKKALEAVKQGKSVTGILTTDGKYMRITNAIRSNKGNGIDDLRLEGVASNCGSDKLAFFFIRVIVHIEGNQAEMTYDSTGIKTLEISLKEAYSMDVRNLIYKKDIDKLSPDTIVHDSDIEPLQELKSILGSYINFDFGFNGNTLTDEDSQFFSNPFDIAELSVLSDSMGLSETECITCNVIMDITETESVMFPCVFKRNRQDEESMWEITGEGTFSRNDGSVWRITIDAMPENNDMDVEFNKLSENNIFKIIDVGSSGTLHQLKLNKPASLLKPSSVVQGQFTEGVYMSVSVMNTTRFDGDENIYMLGMMDLSGDLFYVRGYIADDLLYVDFQEVQEKLEFSSDFFVTRARISIKDDAKRRVFIDLWNKKCGSSGRYNEETHLFELNGLTDITYDEALKIYQFDTARLAGISSSGSELRYNNQWQLCDLTLRTVIPGNTRMVNCRLAGWYKTKIDIWKFGKYEHVSNAEMIKGYGKFPDVQKILNVIAITDNDSGRSAFKDNKRLTDVKIIIGAYTTELDLSDNPLLTFESYQWMVENRQNSSAVTVTVPDEIYSKMTGGSEDWGTIASDAAAKKISFATAG